MMSLIKKPFHLVAFVVSSSVITAFMAAYRWLSSIFNIRELGIIITMFAVLLFMVFIIINLKTIKTPKNYALEIYNTLGEKDDLNFRKDFRNYDVASSYMLMYRKMYPKHTFILVSHNKDTKKTVHRYIE